MSLPPLLFAIPNADKDEYDEKWYDGRSPLNIPWPARIIIAGGPGTGKTNTVKHILMRADPLYEEVFVIHPHPDATHEYDDMGPRCHMLGEIPPPESWPLGHTKRCIVLDDFEFSRLSRDQQRNLSRLLGFVSSHMGYTVILCAQDALSIPTYARRCCNLWVLHRTGGDLDALGMCARKGGGGITTSEIKRIFSKVMSDARDSLWIDLTPGSPYPLRKNGFLMLKSKQCSDAQATSEHPTSSSNCEGSPPEPRVS